MLNFCTLYNSNYSAKGLAMYWSLKRVCPAFHLYIFAFDDILSNALKKMALPEVTVITLKEFEDEELLRVKPTRTLGEYCWTCTASTMLYCLKNFDINSCTYLDADLYFFTNPQVMIDEMGDNDILITPHWYSKECDATETAGKYCVQFIVAKNTTNAIKVLTDWRNDCIDWCYDRYEEGKRGDQMYLMKWQDKYTGIYESQNMGGGIAPWNMQRYSFTLKNGVPYAYELSLKKNIPIIFFHYHDVFTTRKFFLYESSYDVYPITDNCINTIFLPYIKVIAKAYKTMKQLNSNINGLNVTQDTRPLKQYLMIFYKTIRRKDIKRKFWI